MNDDFDDSKILLQGKLKLYLEETPEILHRRISEITAYLIPNAVHLVESEYIGIKQRGLARYFYKISIEEMNTLRKDNINHLRNIEAKEIAKYKSWNLE